MSELKNLASKCVTVSVSGEDIEISPMRVGAWAAFLVAADPFIRQLSEPGTEIGVQILTEHPKAILSAVSVATKLSKDKIDGLYPDEFTNLLQAVLEVNVGFFTQRVSPVVTQLMKTVSNLTQIGDLSSNS